MVKTRIGSSCSFPSVRFQSYSWEQWSLWAKGSQLCGIWLRGGGLVASVAGGSSSSLD